MGIGAGGAVPDADQSRGPRCRFGRTRGLNRLAVPDHGRWAAGGGSPDGWHADGRVARARGWAGARRMRLGARGTCVAVCVVLQNPLD